MWKIPIYDKSMYFFFSISNYVLVGVFRTWCWVNALVVLVVWILIMVYFSAISKTLSSTPGLLVVWRLVMINLSILKRVKWCTRCHLHWLWNNIYEVVHVFLKCFHRTAKLMILQFRFLQHFTFNFHFFLIKGPNLLIIKRFFQFLLRWLFLFTLNIIGVFTFLTAFNIFILIRFVLSVIVKSCLRDENVYLQYLIHSYETEHHLNEQHLLNYCSYFQ